ncbi:MAG: transcription elongation factor GreA [Ruminococcaceae bacterium]|nr:transcription elongation factor GreA [Oscillospiraceae bacterium]
MATKGKLYTQEGFKALKDELDYLKNVKREEVKRDLSTARSFGDLSENSEYDEARNEQAKTEARIKELEELIANAEIIDETKIDTSVVSIGSTVKLYIIEDDEEIEYHIVGSNEADPANGKISDQSPIGKALVESKAAKGSKVVVDTPAGQLHLEVREVARNH